MKKIILLTLLFISQSWANYPVVQTGGGGIPIWAPTTSYTIDQHVNNADKLYRANAAFTSGALFVPANWSEVSDDLNREIVVTDTALVIWDGVGGDDVKDSVVTLDGAGVMAGVTELTGNLTVNGNLDVLGTITTSTQAALDITNAVISVNVGGNQAAANANDAGLVVSISDATNSQIGYDSTCPTFWQAGLVGSLDCVVTETIAQSLTNKEFGNSASIDANLMLDMVSTSKASRPFPIMTEVQRDALTAVTGSGIYNSNTDKVNVYNGTVWKAIGGGIDAWATATVYTIGDVVHESNKIYLALTNHTGGVFATDLGNNEWVELSDDLNREVAVTDNAITRWNGAGGDDVQDSLVIISDLGAVTGVTDLTITGNLDIGLTQNSVVFAGAAGVLSEDNTNFTWNNGTKILNVTGEVDVDNLSLNGNTISSTDVNGNVIVDANGTGQFNVLDYFLMPHLADPASSPAAASSNLFFKADEVLYDMDENGVVNPIDNRNSNDVLANRSFEKSFTGTEDLGWTAVGGATTQTLLSGTANCAPGQGDQCLQVSPVAQTFTFTQNINCDTSDGQLVGFSSWIDTSTYDVEMCSLRAGVVQDCITYFAGNSWKKKKVTVYARTGDTCGVQIRSVAAASGALGIDGVKFETEPIKFSQKRVSQDYSIKEVQSTMTSLSGELQFSGAAVESTGAVSLIVATADGANTRTKWIAQRDCVVTVSADGLIVSGSRSLAVAKNDVILKRSSYDIVGTNATVGVTHRIELLKGDFITLGVAGSPEASGFDIGQQLIANASFTSHVGIVAEAYEEVAASSANSSPNDMSASIIDGVSIGTVTPARETQDFIQGNCAEAIDGTYVCTYVPGFFTSTPNCQATVTDVDNDSILHILAESASSITVRTGTSAAGVVGRDFTLSCDKTGADIKPVELDVNIPFGKTCNIYPTINDYIVVLNSTTLYKTTEMVATNGSCGFVTVSANQARLVPGTYRIEYIVGVGFGADFLSVRLQKDVTGTPVTIVEKPKVSTQTTAGSNTATFFYEFTITSTTSIELQTKAALAVAGGEIHSAVSITKVK